MPVNQIELLLEKTAAFLGCTVIAVNGGTPSYCTGDSNAEFIKGCVNRFAGVNHPVLISGHSHTFCRNCSSRVSCTAEQEIYIPVAEKGLGVIFRWETAPDENEGFLPFLEGIVRAAAVLEDADKAEKDREFFRQVIHCQGEIIGRGMLVLSPDGGVIYQNRLARENNLLDKYSGKKHEEGESGVMPVDGQPISVIPVCCGKSMTGSVILSEAHGAAETEKPQVFHDDKPFHYIIGRDPALVNCISIAEQVADSNSTILIRGESGTGKERFAQAIHKSSYRKRFPFVAINCAAIPESLLESELFGYEEGAFTGAKRGGKKGKIEMADRGTLFLDEIGDMPLALQAKLLRVLQNKRIERIGSVNSISVDVRIICATNQNLEDLIRQNRFREDLFYRINVIPIYLPPLRTRHGDIILLLNHYLRKFCVSSQKGFKTISPDLTECLKHYEWKGNVRELENIVEYGVMMCNGDEIGFEHMPEYLRRLFGQPSGDPASSTDRALQMAENLKEPLGAVKESAFRNFSGEKEELDRLMGQFGKGTEAKRRIAEHLGISLATLYRRLKKYGK